MSDNTSGLLDEETKRNVDKWLDGNYDKETKTEVLRLLKEAPQEIIAAFYTQLSFGTGGLRALMGVGPNRLNIYTVALTIQGFANYIKSFPKGENGYNVIIGYDSRHNSTLFAKEAAKVLAGNGIKALLFNHMCPSPLVSYGCRHYRCNGGIMITASHNPPEYNGLKIYWSDGSQVSFPHDQKILEEIKDIKDVHTVHLALDVNDSHIVEIDKDVESAYIKMSANLQSYKEDNQLYGKDLKIVYTSLHGAGIALLPQVFKQWGFTNIHYVEAQIVPDGNFPTIATPNPENASALAMGIDKLKEVNGDILIATDPDADRVGVAISHQGIHLLINGNQMAALLLKHICKALTAKNKMPANAAFIKSMTTTELFQSIVSYYQKPCFEVPPGFKYVAEKIRLWEDEPRGNQFVFAAEDSCGYLYGQQVRDKDGVTAAALIAEMALQAKLQGKTLLDLLDELYKAHGFFHEELFCLPFDETKEGKIGMTRSLQRLRRAPPRQISAIDVISIEDFERLVKIDRQTRQTTALQFPKSSMLIFWLSDNTKLVIRPSGTEPKLKIYCGVSRPYTDSLDACLKEAQSYTKKLIEDLTQILHSEL